MNLYPYIFKLDEYFKLSIWLVKYQLEVKT